MEKKQKQLRPNISNIYINTLLSNLFNSFDLFDMAHRPIWESLYPVNPVFSNHTILNTTFGVNRTFHMRKTQNWNLTEFDVPSKTPIYRLDLYERYHKPVKRYK